jgi:hypothetical protein
MTPLKKLNSFFREYWSELSSVSYLKINIILAGAVVVMMAYSGIFSPDTNNYPVVCMHEKLTGLKCFSCGLSHSFSLIVRGRIGEANRWNVYGMQVFLFFLLQLVMRISYSVFYISGKNYRKQLVLYDIIGSVALFLVAFYPFFRQIFLELIYSLR